MTKVTKITNRRGDLKIAKAGNQFYFEAKGKLAAEECTCPGLAMKKMNTDH